MFGANSTNSFGSAGARSAGSTFGNNNTSAFGSNAGTNASTATPTFASSTGANGTAGSLFGSSSNTGTFGNQSKPLFGASAPQNKPAGGSSLFGAPAAQKPLFGTGAAGTSQPALNQPSGLLGNGLQQTQQQINPAALSSQSLFNMSSPFSYSSDKNVIHSIAEENLRQSVGTSLQAQQSSQFSSTQASSLSQPLSQFQNNLPVSNGSSLTGSLGSALSSGYTTPNYRRQPTTPGWAQERRYTSTQPSNQKHVSSFNKSERSTVAPTHRKTSISLSQSPTVFGTSFSGIPKPSHTKKKTFIQEDPPPTRSIYDNDSSPFGSEITSNSLPEMAFTGSGNGSSTSTSTSSSKPSSSGQSSSQSLPVGQSGSEVVSVIIFGFPASLTQAVVSHFVRFGKILENVDSNRRSHPSPSKGNKKKSYPTQIHTGKNWIKITYDNPGSAARAIQENGIVFAGQYIIGCVPATAQKLKEFEKACETSSIHGEFQDSLYSIPRITNTDLESNSALDNTLVTPKKSEPAAQTKSPFGNSRGAAKRESIPVLAGSKRSNIQDGRHIFNSPAKQMRYAPSLFKHSQDQDKSANGATNSSKRLQPGKTGWIAWTGKKAQELVFGWDDL